MTDSVTSVSPESGSSSLSTMSEVETVEEEDGLESKDGIKEERSFDDDNKSDQVVQEEIVNFTCTESKDSPIVSVDAKEDSKSAAESSQPSSDGTKNLSVEPPAPPRPKGFNIFPSLKLAMDEESVHNLSEAEKHKLEKLQSLRVKYLRLVHRLRQSIDISIAEHVLHRLALLSGKGSGQSFSLDAAKKKAMESEAEGEDDLNFSVNILVLGKSGVGKSATINSIFGEQNAPIDAFGPSTTSVREISGTVGGVKITIIDTPGLKSSAMDQNANSKMLSSVKKAMKKCPPDVVLYVDRLDTQTKDLNNLLLIKTIAASLGPSILKNAIVTLTHAASAPPDGPSGNPLNYDVFVSQCSYLIQQSIGQAVGLTYSGPMTPVSLVENHPLCRKNRAGEKILPNGQAWKPGLLLLCYSLKVLSEAVSLSIPPQESKFFGSRVRAPPLSSILSWLLPSRAHLKLPADQGGAGVDSDIEIDDVSDSEQEEDDEYDQLPPFKPLRKSQLAKLSKEQRNAYFDEYNYREKLLKRKQWKEELRRMRETKKNGKKIEDEPEEEEDDPLASSSPALLPDIELPTSFDSDNSAYRYRSLEPTSKFLTRSLLDPRGWDNDCGFDCVIAEHSLAIAKRFPAAFTVQMTKDKKEFNIHLESSVCAKHGDNRSTMAELHILGSEQLMYLLRGETKAKIFKKNKMTFGGTMAFIDRNIVTGLKLEDQIALGKRLVLVGNAGTTRSQGDSAYEANLEVRFREADFPIGQNQLALGLSLTKSNDDLTLKPNLRSQVCIGGDTRLAASASIDNKRFGQVTVRASGSDQWQISGMAILALAMTIYKRFIRSGDS
ncbi:translocase of chloroplast 159, chloroplastic [Eutrema salsugineum]|nr:translocase of chloroplast 159, chloroplastic [Eutrema salsugineum]